MQLRALPATLVLYAPPHGLAAIMADVAAVLGTQRRVVVARELTKLHEEFFRCALQCVSVWGNGGQGLCGGAGRGASSAAARASLADSDFYEGGC